MQSRPVTGVSDHAETVEDGAVNQTGQGNNGTNSGAKSRGVNGVLSSLF
jgi:hypothetical protein